MTKEFLNMTAEFHDRENELELEEIEDPKATEPRPVEKILGLPYSELTDEEIQSVIDFKVNEGIREQEYRDKLEIAQKEADERIEILKDKAEYDKNLLNRLTAHAIDRYEDASNG